VLLRLKPLLNMQKVKNGIDYAMLKTEDDAPASESLMQLCWKLDTNEGV